ncbi:hypothetical protein FHS94_000043 [Sphingomonas aerophila]|uniref:Uncharacterized protein n=1 Tax=Sphingomonas aerophila TaxID=1344948 RepID=A0A7W9ESL1_9SPHN|nr:hypothetical protein [Sphingomonas aerophila]
MSLKPERSNTFDFLLSGAAGQLARLCLQSVACLLLIGAIQFPKVSFEAELPYLRPIGWRWEGR